MNLLPDLRDRNVVITGGSLGIGLATAKKCLQLHANVTICGRNPNDIDRAIETLKQEGYSNVLGVPADVSLENQVIHLLDRAEKRFGKINSVVHAAAVCGPIGPITQVDPEEWFNTIRINLFGTFLVARQSCLRFQSHGGGRLVLFSGGGAAGPFPNYTPYACSKAAVVRLTESIAQEMAGHHIEVNCLGPGFVITRIHQQTLQAGALAGREYLERTKAEIAKGGVPIELGATAAAFLISKEADGITGKFIAAPYDSWKDFPKYLKELKETDIFTLRRIVPKDRGMAWQ